MDDLVLWAQGVQARAAARADDEALDERVRLVGQVSQLLAKLRGPAGDAERAVLALRLYLQEDVATDGPNPPGRPEAVALWALRQLAGLLHEAATSEAPDAARILHRAKSLSVIGLLLPQRELKRLVDRLEREAG